jgi:hypothetical protein
MLANQAISAWISMIAHSIVRDMAVARAIGELRT